MKHFVYIVVCKNEELYTGYTIDIDKRVETHNSGKGAKYTKTRLPVKLVYSEQFENKSEALKREYKIKSLSRIEKLKLINKGK
jgi:putative endonuclease